MFVKRGEAMREWKHILKKNLREGRKGRRKRKMEERCECFKVVLLMRESRDMFVDNGESEDDGGGKEG